MARHHSKRSANLNKIIALERIDILFNQAYHNRYDPVLSKKYVERSRDIAMYVRTRIPKVYRRQFCKVCHSYFVPGENVRNRIQHGKVIVTCKTCGHITRYPLK
ncbi:MAG TPA: ribonuclease P [Methanocorpusculum sp.]|nr:ribonuclease P [Methanocorpusculum sp.]